MKIAFIGAGNMTEAMVAGMLKKGFLPADSMVVADICAERRSRFEAVYGVQALGSNAAAAAGTDVLVLAVKPQVFQEVWADLEKKINTATTLVVSIMAGVTSNRIAHGETQRVVRVMPNAPALVGSGASGIAAGKFATEADVELVVRLMEAVGEAVVVDESDLDAVTALSGSGPAYVFYLLEGMLEAVDEMGIDPDVARKLSLAAVNGAADMMQASDETAAALRTKVTSKGGTTAAAINTLDKHHVKRAIIAALHAAQTRSKELAAS